MIMYFCHALKLEGVYRVVSYLCVDQMRYNIKKSQGTYLESVYGSISRCILKQNVYLLHAGSCLTYYSNPEDGSDMFLRNIGRISTDYTALYPKRLKTS
jgi:hypothetical protein